MWRFYISILACLIIFNVVAMDNTPTQKEGKTSLLKELQQYENARKKNGLKECFLENNHEHIWGPGVVKVDGVAFFCQNHTHHLLFASRLAHDKVCLEKN
ncbi:hypothetical protein A3F06_01235 [candidate division TM6 bacterium RIFCSPHIGHO2_12_FULL_36_22]|nr:MAG: hypothetical protein A3F06_01235 [candidate division TM6 bacterium RIFCSPHIGHO2_12_FULL_36_22]